MQTKNSNCFFFDDIFIASNSNSENFIPSWFGDYATMKNSKLTVLEGRKSMAYVFDLYNPISMLYGAKLFEKADSMKIAVKLYPINANNVFSITSNNGLGVMKLSSAEFQNQRKDLTRNLNYQGIKEISRSDYFETAERFHGLKLVQLAHNAELTLTSVEDLDAKAPRSKSLVYPLCGPEDLIYLHGDSLVNNTMLCLDFCIMITLGEIYGSGRFFVPSPVKVLYIDSGNGFDPLKEMISLLRSLYKNNNLNKENFNIFSVANFNRKINLLSEEDRKIFETKIGDAKFVVINNLPGVVPLESLNKPNELIVVISWLRSLIKKRNITILLVNYSNKSRGADYLENEADLIIHLKKPMNCPENQTSIEVHFPQSKSNFIDQYEPFLVGHFTSKSINKRSVLGLDGTALFPKWMVSGWEKKHHTLSELEILILAMARINGEITAGEIMGKVQLLDRALAASPSSVSRVSKALVEKGLLKMEGSGGSAYYVATSRKPFDGLQNGIPLSGVVRTPADQPALDDKNGVFSVKGSDGLIPTQLSLPSPQSQGANHSS